MEKSRRYAQNIIASGRSLLNLINDLLDLAKAEAGKMELHIEKTALGALCESIAEFFAPISMEKEQEVSLSVDPDIPLLLTDPGKLRQILSNLFSNAVKFTPAGGRIRFSAAMLDDKTVRIILADNGPGIAKENHQTIFEKFRQVDGSITRPGQGTGLGLAISRELTSLFPGRSGWKANWVRERPSSWICRSSPRRHRRIPPDGRVSPRKLTAVMAAEQADRPHGRKPQQGSQYIARPMQDHDEDRLIFDGVVLCGGDLDPAGQNKHPHHHGVWPGGPHDG